jgi:S-adenosylmethionine synthetase
MALEVNRSYQGPELLEQEVVERKGLGHPDTLVDGIAEFSEIQYAKHCLERFGAIPHHNLDKAMLLGGLCVQQFGGNDFESPLRMIFMGRASKSFGGEEIPLADLQDQAARTYLRRVMPHLDTSDAHVYSAESLTSDHSTRPFWFSPRSIEDLPEYMTEMPRANDTATMISYWPLTETEKLTLDLEGFFYSDDEHGMPVPRFDFVGQDIKVMSVRNGNIITSTLAIPQITTHTADAKEYFDREKYIEEVLQEYAQDKIGDTVFAQVIVNTETKGPNPRPYLVTGGSCTDFGEEGAVGRGNKTHGIISSFRPNTMEAPHGKNPTYFVGKLLGYQADLISKQIYEQLGSRCQVILQANLGDDLFDPSRIIVSTESDVAKIDVDRVVAECLGLGRETTNRIINDAHFLPRTNVWNAHGKQGQ